MQGPWDPSRSPRPALWQGSSHPSLLHLWTSMLAQSLHSQPYGSARQTWCTLSSQSSPCLLLWPIVSQKIPLAKKRCVCSWIAFSSILITMVTKQFVNITRISLTMKRGQYHHLQRKGKVQLSDTGPDPASAQGAPPHSSKGCLTCLIPTPILPPSTLFCQSHPSSNSSERWRGHHLAMGSWIKWGRTVALSIGSLSSTLSVNGCRTLLGENIPADLCK